jgi:hypothetical protein
MLNLETGTVEHVPTSPLPTSVLSWTSDIFLLACQGSDTLYRFDEQKMVKSEKVDGVAGRLIRAGSADGPILMITLTPCQTTGTYDTHVYGGHAFNKIAEIKGFYGISGTLTYPGLAALPYKQKGFSLLDGKTFVEKHRFAVDTDGIGSVLINPTLGHIYGLVSGDPSILIVADPFSGKELQRIKLGKNACSMVCNEHDGRVYVLNADDRTVSVLAGETISSETLKELDAFYWPPKK